jgi:undecaprenyl diphosphate synthase
MSKPSHIPNHIALIMDGNGRWAEQRGLDRAAGHERGVRAAELAYRACHERRVPHCTLYAFSHANWKRPKDEVERLMRLCAAFCDDNRAELCERGIRMEVIGDLDELPTATRRSVEETVAATAAGDRMVLTLALDYGCRHDLVGAVRAIAAHARAGILLPEEIDERAIRSFMSTGKLPDPDLVIRTGGEKRLSDFLLFEAAMSELFFSERMWPDFDEATLDAAIEAYGRRQRRFGRTGDQLTELASGA